MLARQVLLLLESLTSPDVQLWKVYNLTCYICLKSILIFCRTEFLCLVLQLWQKSVELLCVLRLILIMWIFSLACRYDRINSTFHLVLDCSVIFFFWDRILLCSPGWSGIHCVPCTGLELRTLLLQPLQCWDYRHVIPCLAMCVTILYIVRLCLLTFCWRFLPLYLQELLIHSLLFCFGCFCIAFTWFWYQHNTGFIKWIQECSFPFCFLEDSV
jgi:hypothetical protein